MKVIMPDWPAPAGIKAVTTVRSFWGSADFSETDSTERKRLTSILDLPADPAWLKQTHSTIVVDAANCRRNQEADAAYTNQPEHVCLVLTADCLPILICDKQAGRVAAIHAGWRGLANGIVENTIQAMLSAAENNRGNLMAWLGPAIGPQKFEVGADVYHAFTDNDPECTSCFIPGAPGKWLANLYQLATRRLNISGVTDVYGGDYCTYTQQDMFYSWRRDQSKTGRMASLIWIEKK